MTSTRTQSRCRAELGRGRTVKIVYLAHILCLFVSSLRLSTLLAIFAFVLIRSTSCEVVFELKLLVVFVRSYIQQEYGSTGFYNHPTERVGIGIDNVCHT